MRNKWSYSLLWTNLAAALVILIQLAGEPMQGRAALHTLAITLVYANLTGSLSILVLGGWAERLASRRIPLLLVVAFGLIFFTAVGCLLAQTLLMQLGLAVPLHFWREYWGTLRTALPLAIVFGSGALVYGSLRGRVHLIEQQLRQREISEQRALVLAAEARLRLLESRIHPHFLFNTLNTISSLVALDPPRAEQVVGRLATLLRASLDTGNHALISLRQELTMVESYIEIERVRFGGQLQDSIDVPEELLEARVPPMSVQSLVENAVKHGITSRAGGGRVQVFAAAENGSLHIEVRDTGPGFDLTQIPSGHGLDNLVQRLDALFGTRARLNVLRTKGRSVVELILPRL